MYSTTAVGATRARDAKSLISRRSFLRAAAAGAVLPPLGGARVRERCARHRGALQRHHAGIAVAAAPAGTPTSIPITPPYLADPPAVDSDRRRPPAVRRRFPDRRDDAVADVAPGRRTTRRIRSCGPRRAWELRDDVAERTKPPPNPAAMVFSDGVFFDPRDRLFKMWYMGGYGAATCLATSHDGIAWQRPSFDVVPGTNIVNTALPRFEHGVARSARARSARAATRCRCGTTTTLILYDLARRHPLDRDRRAPARTGDRSTFFYNPFRQRLGASACAPTSTRRSISGRYRRYWESPRLRAGAATGTAARRWRGSRPTRAISRGPELTATAGALQPRLRRLRKRDARAVLDLARRIGGAREDQRGHRRLQPRRLPLASPGSTARSCRCPTTVGSWNWAQRAVGRRRLPDRRRSSCISTSAAGRAGPAPTRRASARPGWRRCDATASRRWTGCPDERRVTRVGSQPSAPGTLTTRPVRFTGAHLFVNADLDGGELRVEVLDRSGRGDRAVHPRRLRPITGNGTRLRGRRGTGVARRRSPAQHVRFRFSMTRGRLYAFWVSPWPTGESRGYPAAGGPEFAGPIDRREPRRCATPLARGSTAHASPVAVADHARARPVLHVRVGAAPLGLARHRSVPRAGAQRWRAASRSAPPTCRGATPITSRVVLPPRSASASGCRSRAGHPQRLGRRCCSIASCGRWSAQRRPRSRRCIVGIFSFNTVYASTQSSDAICTCCSCASLVCFARGRARIADRLVRAGGVLSGTGAAVPAEHDPVSGVIIAARIVLSRRGLAAQLSRTMPSSRWSLPLLQMPWIVRNYRLTGTVPADQHARRRAAVVRHAAGRPVPRKPRAQSAIVFESAPFDYTSLRDRSMIIDADLPARVSTGSAAPTVWSTGPIAIGAAARATARRLERTGRRTVRDAGAADADDALLLLRSQARRRPHVTFTTPPDGAANPFVCSSPTITSATSIATTTCSTSSISSRLLRHVAWPTPCRSRHARSRTRRAHRPGRHLRRHRALLGACESAGAPPRPFAGIDVAMHDAVRLRSAMARP